MDEAGSSLPHCCACCVRQDELVASNTLFDGAINIVVHMAELSPSTRCELFDVSVQYITKRLQMAMLPRLPQGLQ